MLDNENRFVIENYGKKSTFAGFLPGISGKFGIPVWCYYVNRGQCITSFGIENKDHAIMEFFPAHQAYQNTKKLGFRTFLKKNGRYIEPFSTEDTYKKMAIGMNDLEIIEIDYENEIETSVQYFTLPNERVGALVRKVTIRNISTKEVSLEILDGMPAVVPYGVNLNSMKNMGQTSKAWMKVEDADQKRPYFRVRVSMEDTAAVTEVIDGNFGFSVLESGEALTPIVDSSLVFDYDTSLDRAEGFASTALEELLLKKQVIQNTLPCCLFGKKILLNAGEAVTIKEVFGKTENKEILSLFTKKCSQPTYFEQKEGEAVKLTQELCSVIETRTGSKIFDNYCRQTYLDNVLRGGYPIILGRDKIFYLYSRKHGDIERDYNYFTMLPEFYSQGNSNYRDVNQNRRSDVVFAPYVKEVNVKTFYNLIQIDGYNPLSVDKVSYRIKEEDLRLVNTGLNEGEREDLLLCLNSEFTPGKLLMTLESSNYENKVEIEQLFQSIIDASIEEVNGTFSEGYWSDHWTYNLDLVESYLIIYPDKEEELLFEDVSYTYFEAQVMVLPRNKRYVRTEQGIRQYNFLNKEIKKNTVHKLLKADYGRGETVSSALFEKLILLNTLKYATLDPYGMGIEMEGGKPGWYDALNGLPGLFGSSMAETCELSRMLNFTIESLRKYRRSVAVFVELAELIAQIDQITREQKCNLSSDQEVLEFWNAVNAAKESFREKTLYGVCGEKIVLSDHYLVDVLVLWDEVVSIGIQKATGYGEGIIPTYFSYEIAEYDEAGGEIVPRKFIVHPLPSFLEGPVRFLKLEQETQNKKELYNKVKSSALYDKKLSMYKVNASLAEASYEIGRAKAFTPGWLENESIWLHMEYKYLLELLKSGLYEEYFEDFKKTCIPFLNPEVYGRSILENVSFIASSVNPDEKIHGKGFVARLSGSTAEFLNMWQIMMFGRKPFRSEDGKLSLAFEPAIPEYLIDEGKVITAKFLGTITVTYRLREKKALIPGHYNVKSIEVLYADNKQVTITDKTICHTLAMDIRNGRAISIAIDVDNSYIKKGCYD